MMRKIMLVAVLMLLHFSIAAYVAVHILGGVPHIPDSAVYYEQAVLLDHGQLYVSNFTREPQYAYKRLGMFVRNDNAYYHYNHFWPALLAVPVKLGTASYLNPLLSAFSLLFVFLIGRRLFNENTGLIAALVYCFSPFTILMAADFMSHTATQFLLLAGVCSLFNYMNKGKPVAALLTGICFGYAFNIRPLTAIGVVAPFVIVSVWWYRKKVFRWNTCWHLAGFAAMFSLFLLDNWIVMGDALKPVHPLSAGGWSTISSSLFANGINLVESSVGVLPQILWYGFIPMLFVGFAFIPFVAYRNRNDWLLLSVFVSLLFVYMFTNALGLHGYGPRYAFEAVFALFILVGRGADWCIQRVSGRTRAVVIFVLSLLLVHNIFGAFTILPRYDDYNGINDEIVDKLKILPLDESIVMIHHSWNWYTEGVTATLYDPAYSKTFFIKEDYDKTPVEVLDENPNKIVYVLYDPAKIISYAEYAAMKGNSTS